MSNLDEKRMARIVLAFKLVLFSRDASDEE